MCCSLTAACLSSVLFLHTSLIWLEGREKETWLLALQCFEAYCRRHKCSQLILRSAQAFCQPFCLSHWIQNDLIHVVSVADPVRPPQRGIILSWLIYGGLPLINYFCGGIDSRLIYSNKKQIWCSTFSVSPDGIHLHFVVNMTKYISECLQRELSGQIFMAFGYIYTETLLSFIAPSDCKVTERSLNKTCKKEVSGLPEDIWQDTHAHSLGLMSVVIIKYLERSLDRPMWRMEEGMVQGENKIVDCELGRKAIMLPSPTQTRSSYQRVGVVKITSESTVSSAASLGAYRRARAMLSSSY